MASRRFVHAGLATLTAVGALFAIATTIVHAQNPMMLLILPKAQR